MRRASTGELADKMAVFRLILSCENPSMDGRTLGIMSAAFAVNQDARRSGRVRPVQVVPALHQRSARTTK